jgi:hypothetical protein
MKGLIVGKALLEESQPPSTGSRFIVGRDECGRWVVSDNEGLVGGLFTDREAALHFAMFESDHIPGAVCCTPDNVILSLGPKFHEQPSTPRSVHT